MNHDQPPSLQPRHATARNQERATDGALVARFSELLGKPLIPWQRQVIDVISEIDPSTGTYWYDELVLTVQRQAGKTTITKATTCATRCGGRTARPGISPRPARTPTTSFAISSNHGANRDCGNSPNHPA